MVTWVHTAERRRTDMLCRRDRGGGGGGGLSVMNFSTLLAAGLIASQESSEDSFLSIDLWERGCGAILMRR